MRATFGDHLRALSNAPPPRRTLWREVRGRIWLDHALWRSGLSINEFERTYIHRGRSTSNLVKKWRTGSALPVRASAAALERLLPGTLWLFDLPLFPLLADKQIPKRELIRLTRELLGESWAGLPEWHIPVPDPYGHTVYSRISSRELVHRGDIWGLCVLICAMRWAELEGAVEKHMEASKDAFRSLPALLREPWTSESVRPLYELINRIRNRMPYSATLFQVRWETIELLAAKPDFEANPLRRSKSGSKDPEKYPDPIITMRLVPNKTRQLW